MRSPESPATDVAPGIALAGALQATLQSLPERDFVLDVQQQASLEGIGSALVVGETMGYVEMPTGTGKSTVEALLAEAAHNAGQRVLILAPSVTGARQIVGREFDRRKGLARFTGLTDRQTVRGHYGTRRANSTVPVVVSTYNGFLKDYQRDHDVLGNFDVIIADECHRSLGEKTARAMVEAFPDAIKIGLSATPDYASDRTSEEVYSQSLFEFSLADAIESGKTAPVRALVVETDTTLALADKRAEFTEQEQAPLMYDSDRNLLVARMAADFVRQGRQGIVACVAGGGNFHARGLAQLLSRPEFGEVRAADIGGHLDRAEVAKRLKAFERGEIDVLTSTRAILESWDSGRASFCINTAPTTSPVKLKQLLGRILRPKADGNEATFVDLIDSQTGIGKQQYTALHALGLEEADLTRVLGRPRNQTHPYTPHLAELPEFSGDLLERLSGIQGRTLTDILKSQSATTVDPLVLHWEHVLAKEGLPAELPAHPVVPERFTALYDKALARLMADNGVVPEHQEVLEAIADKLTREGRRALEAYGIPQPLDRKALAKRFVTDEDAALDVVARQRLTEQLDAVLDTLSEREAGVISLRHGLGQPATDAAGFIEESRRYTSPTSYDKWLTEQVLGDKPWTREQTSWVYGVTRERIYQIEYKTMSKLRHPSRSDVLREHLDGPDPYEQLTPRQQAKLDSRYANPRMLQNLKALGAAGPEALGVYRQLRFAPAGTDWLPDEEPKTRHEHNLDVGRQLRELFVIGLQADGIEFEIAQRKRALQAETVGRFLVAKNTRLDHRQQDLFFTEGAFYYRTLRMLERLETDVRHNSIVRWYLTYPHHTHPYQD